MRYETSHFYNSDFGFGFNQRPMTEKDFYEICERENIHVLETDISNSFYMSVLGQSIIVLSRRKKGLRCLYAMFHELGHHFLHAGRAEEEAFYFGRAESKQEMEADAFATIALIPKNKMDSLEFLEDHPNRFARKVFKDRKKLDFLYGI